MFYGVMEATESVTPKRKPTAGKMRFKTLQIHSCVSGEPFQNLFEDQVPGFVEELSTTVQEETAGITNSSATIAAIVAILNTVTNISTTVDEAVATVGCLRLYPVERRKLPTCYEIRIENTIQIFLKFIFKM